MRRGEQVEARHSGTLSVRARPSDPDGEAALHRLANDLSTERLVRGIRDNLFGVALERVVGFALIILLPVVLSPASLGVYFEVAALVSLLQVMALLGTDVGLVRFTALAASRSNLGAIREHLIASHVIATATSVVLSVGLWVAAPVLGHIYGSSLFSTTARIAAVALPFLVSTYLLVAPSTGMKVMYPSVVALQVTQPVVQLALTLALVWLGAGLTGAMTAFGASVVVAWGAAMLMLGRLRLPRTGMTLPRVVARDGPRLLRFSLPVSGMMLAGTALLWLDTLLLGSMRPAREVATYGVVVRLMTAASAATVTVTQMFGPYITQLVEARDTGRLQRYLATCTRLMVIVAAPLLVLLSVIGGPTLHLLHQEAGSGQEALIILCGAFLVQAATGPVGQVLTMSGRSMLNFVDSSIAVLVNVVCNLVLIPRLGLVGAALSWSIAVVGMNLARVFQVRSILGISPVSRTLLRPAIALAVAVAATLAARSTVLSLLPELAAIAALVVGFAAVYLATLVGLGLYAEDRLLFRAILGRRANREVA